MTSPPHSEQLTTSVKRDIDIQSSLEDTLRLLRFALNSNATSDDDWAGKPKQEPFRVYDPLTEPNRAAPQMISDLAHSPAVPATTTATPVSSPCVPQMSTHGDVEEGHTNTPALDKNTEADVSGTKPTSSESYIKKSSVGEPHQEKKARVDARSSLDALMSEYVAALRGLRAADRDATTSNVKAETTEGHNVIDHTITPSAQQPAVQQRASPLLSDEPSTQNVPLEAADMQSLLDALDQLPPLVKK